MKKLTVTVAVLLPQLVLLPFWYMQIHMSIYEISGAIPDCQMLYNGLIGPLIIGIYGTWEIIKKNESAWKVSMFCLLLIMLVEFTGYANWGLSTGYFLEPDSETKCYVIFESGVAVVITGSLLILSFAVRGLNRFFSKKRETGNGKTGETGHPTDGGTDADGVSPRI